MRTIWEIIIGARHNQTPNPSVIINGNHGMWVAAYKATIQVEVILNTGDSQFQNIGSV